MAYYKHQDWSPTPKPGYSGDPDQGYWGWRDATDDEISRLHFGADDGFSLGGMVNDIAGGLKDGVSGLPSALNDMRGGLAVALGGPALGGAITGALPGGIGALNGAGSFAGDIAGAGGTLSGGSGSATLAGSAGTDTLATSMPAAIPETSQQLAQWGMTGAPYAGAAGAGSVWSQAALPAMAGAGAGLGSALGSGLGSLLSNPGLIGGVLGAGAGLLGGGSKPAGNVSITQDPWGPQQPYLQALFPGATQNISDTLSGKYLTPDSNPYLASYGKALSDQVGASVDSRFEASGRYGGGLHAGEVAHQVGNTLAGLYGNAYTNERNLQSNAATGLMSKNFGATQTSPYFTNPTGSAISGALAGSQIGRLWS